MNRLELKDAESFVEATNWLHANGHGHAWTMEYAKRTNGSAIVFKIFDDAVAVSLKLVLGHLFK